MAHNPQRPDTRYNQAGGNGAAGGNGSPRPAGTMPGSRNVPIPLQPGQAMPREEAGEEQASGLSEYLRNAPAWMVSAVVHMLALIILGMLFLSGSTDQIEILSNPWAEDLGDPTENDPLSLETPEPDPNFDAITPQNLPKVLDPFSAPPKVEVTLDGADATSDILAAQVGTALTGRMEGSRDALLRKFGGDKSTEAAVAMALAWLARNQQQDGSWSLTGPFDDGVRPEEPAAATAMALLAFQGNGHTHKRGKYRDNVSKGAKWLVSHQNEEGSWDPNSGHHRMYMHGQATIALCELYGMTKDSAYRDPAEKAIAYCVKTQGKRGGWRYNPADGTSDTSVTGWILMGLQSAKMGGLEVPQETFDRISDYLDAAQTNEGSKYGYLAGTDTAIPSMTAEALLCRQYLGWKRDNKHLQEGVAYLLRPEHLPTWQAWDDFKGRGRDVYHWYYAAQALHHMEGPSWDRWNAVMKPTLVRAQVKVGRERGSWDPDGDKWGPHGGRLYVTCLCVYMLEVYYRHLPIYSKGVLR